MSGRNGVRREEGLTAGPLVTSRRGRAGYIDRMSVRPARWLFPLLLTLPLPARAIDEQSEVSVGSQKTLPDYFADLEGDSDPDRLYAARVLKSMLARSLRTEAHAPAGSLASLDARSLLVELEARLPNGCRVAVTHKNAVGPCADILALLEDRAALPRLQELRGEELRPAVQRKLDVAIARLAALPPDPATAAPTSAATDTTALDK